MQLIDAPGARVAGAEGEQADRVAFESVMLTEESVAPPVFVAATV